MDKIWWNELWLGELGPHYAESSNITQADQLMGRLLLAVGEMDTDVDPSRGDVIGAGLAAGLGFAERGRGAGPDRADVRQVRYHPPQPTPESARGRTVTQARCKELPGTPGPRRPSNARDQ